MEGPSHAFAMNHFIGATATGSGTSTTCLSPRPISLPLWLRLTTTRPRSSGGDGVGKVKAVQQKEVTLETVERWIAMGHIRGAGLPSDFEMRSHAEQTALLTRMFELPAQLDEDPSV